MNFFCGKCKGKLKQIESGLICPCRESSYEFKNSVYITNKKDVLDTDFVGKNAEQMDGVWTYAKECDEIGRTVECALGHLDETILSGVAIDMGCGTGHYVKELAKRFSSLLAVDTCSDFLLYFAAKAAPLPDNVTLIADSGSSLPLAQGSISLIFSAAFWPFKPMLEVWDQWLCPGGKIVIVSENWYCSEDSYHNYLLDEYRASLPDEPKGFRYFSFFESNYESAAFKTKPASRYLSERNYSQDVSTVSGLKVEATVTQEQQVEMMATNPFKIEDSIHRALLEKLSGKDVGDCTCVQVREIRTFTKAK